jgi:hypothetical protein
MALGSGNPDREAEFAVYGISRFGVHQLACHQVSPSG